MTKINLIRSNETTDFTVSYTDIYQFIVPLHWTPCLNRPLSSLLQCWQTVGFL